MLFYFFSVKNPVYRDSNSRPNVSEGYEVTPELPGRPAPVLDVCNTAVMIVSDCYFVCRDSLRSSEKGMYRILMVQSKRFRPGRTGKGKGKSLFSLFS